jgi:DNA polymerase-3 subunit delta
MTPAQARAQIAAGTTAPVYLLECDDQPSRHDLAQAFLGLVDEGLQAFNVARFFGRDATNAGTRDTMVADILAAARTLPMMSPRRVILLHDADVLLTPRRAKEDEAPEAGRSRKRVRSTTPAEDFEAYVASPEPMTTLVIDAPPLDRGRRITKLLVQHAQVVNCGELNSAEDVARWVAARLDRDELSIEPAATRALIDAVGIDLPRIRGEIDKLVLYAAGETTITASHVRDVVVSSDESAGVFALVDYIKNGNPAAAIRELGALFESGSPGPMILGLVRTAAVQLRPDARARRGLTAVFDADLALKSSAGEPRFVLERRVVELCGGAPGAAARRSWP